MYLPLEEISIKKGSSLIYALELMDVRDRKLLIILDDENNYVDLLSVGDIQRAILKNKDLQTPIEEVTRESTKVAHISDDKSDIHDLMREFRMEFMPILDDDNKLDSVIFWEEITGQRTHDITEKFNLPVVLMAGGLGSRMKPLTNVLPKPLIPVGEVTIAEEIFNRFSKYGVNRFLLSLNYKADFIESYLNQQHLPFEISTYRETKPLGTIGSLTLMKDDLKSTFFVSNCDILINNDYSKILNYHKRAKNEITMVSALKTVKLPYGVIETKEGGQIDQLKEKPNLGFNVNTGMYIIEPHVIDYIPEGQYYNVTDLIQFIMNKGGRVGAFPVSEGSWVDTGVWEEYIKNYVNS